MVGVGVREYNLYTATAHAGTRAWTLQIVVVPTTRHLNSKLVHVVVVVSSRRSAVEWAVAFLVVGVALLVPILAQTFVATVLHRPHRMFFTLVDIEHLSAILGFVDVQHLTTANGASAIWIVSVANLLHFLHVLARDTFVAALKEQNGRIIAVINNGITHQGCTLLPAWTFHIFFCIAGRHGLNQTHTVARLDILLPRCYMHPAHQVTIRFYHQIV